MHVHWAAVVTAISALLIAIVGWFVSSAFRTQTRAHLFERRLDAYAALWQQLAELSVKPADHRDRDPATADCVRIGRALTAWYYTDGGGMFLTDPTRALWIALRDNLLNGGGGPVTLSRHASLLRTQLKADLEVYYGRNVSGDPLRTNDEVVLLRSTVLSPTLFAELPRSTRGWMWLRYHVLRRDDPAMRARALWLGVMARGLTTAAGPSA